MKKTREQGNFPLRSRTGGGRACWVTGASGLVHLITQPSGNYVERTWARNKVPDQSHAANKNRNNPYVQSPTVSCQQRGCGGRVACRSQPQVSTRHRVGAKPETPLEKTAPTDVGAGKWR